MQHIQGFSRQCARKTSQLRLKGVIINHLFTMFLYSWSNVAEYSGIYSQVHKCTE